ncbi:hypothetical protein JW935_18775 [candidate division KSB1 bacterium]|nr:hypothetical protein [candidate division KSB1 bacterium]
MRFKLMCFVVIFVLSAVVIAQEKTIFTIGGSYWNAAYAWEDEDGNSLYEIDPGNNFGPYLSVSRGKLNLGVSYMIGKYPISSIIDSKGKKVELDNEINMTRGDLNVTVGYRAHRFINLFVGLKRLNWSFEVEESFTVPDNYDYYDYYDYYNYGSQTTTYNIKMKDTQSGLLFGAGASGVVPLGRSGLYLFGSLAYLGGKLEEKTEISGMPFSIDSDQEPVDISTGLVALNVGLGYRWPNGLGVNVGYRGDLIQQTTTDEETDEDYINYTRVQGVNVTLSYTIR